VSLSKMKASLAVAAMTLVSYSAVWAQGCGEFSDRPECAGGGNDGGGGTVGGGTVGGGNGVPELDGPWVFMLVAVGIVAAIAIAKRK